MRKLVIAIAITTLATVGVANAGQKGKVVKTNMEKSVAQQLVDAQAPANSALAHFITSNQSAAGLDAGIMGCAATNRSNLPRWAVVSYLRKHPNLKATAGMGRDCFIPLVRHEFVEWAMSHPNMEPPTDDQGPGPVTEEAYQAGANVRSSGSQSSPRSESDIRVNYWNPNLIIGASNNISSTGRQAQFYSSDGGSTWGQTLLSLQTGDAFMSDPTVDWTSDGTAWATTIGINSAGSVLHMRAYKSTNNGATWSFDATFSGSQSNTDKQMMWVDHSSTSPYADNIYAIYHNGAPVYIGRRTGGSWQSPVLVSGSETTGTGIGADIKSNANGDVFGMWPDTGSRKIYVVKSTNGGSSWSSPTTVASTYGSFQMAVPADASRQVLIASIVGTYRTATKNNVYAVWNDLSGDSGCTSGGGPGTNASSSCKSRIFFSRSTDGGATWSSKVKINNQSGLNDQIFPWMVVDETTGKIAVTYYDTVGDSTRKSVNVYYQSSSDDGQTWTTPLKVTTASTNETTSGADSGNQFGDYATLSGINGSFHPSWTDRRSGSYEEIWTATVTDDSGTCTPLAAPTGVSATASGQNAANVSWGSVSGAVSYTVARSTTSGSGYVAVGTTGSTSLSDTGLSCGTTYYYVVSDTNNSSCTSAYSSQATVTTDACTGGGPQNAAYDSTLKAPKCSLPGSSCDSGTSLLLGRASLGPEPNQPNTINSSCADGTSGSFHSDESIDQLKVATNNGSDMAAGSQVTVTATVWAYSGYTSDALDLYYTADATSPSWTLIGTMTPSGSGAQTMTGTYTLPSGSLQAVRANFRYQGSASSCSTGSYDDHDDLIFAVGGGTTNVPPTAAFGSTTSGLTANFTDSSTDSDGTIASRSWNFGDGGTSTATNPSHTYSTGGTYTVTLTVTDNGGATDSVSHNVTVTAPNVPPTAAFTFTTSNLTANFTDGSSDSDGTIASRSWNFGDGGASTATNPSHTYATGGTYTVTLTVTDNNGATGSVSHSVTVSAANVPPTAAFTFTTSGLTANFTDGSSDSDGTIASRSWNFGDGATSTATNPSHTYSSSGSYTVTLTVTDNNGATGNVSHSVSVSGGGGGGAQNAAYDSTLKAPKCGTVGSSCDSTTLLNSRGTLSPAETNHPNTINNSCTDGNSGTYHSDESLDSLKIATNDGTDFAAGKTVTVTATVYAWSTGSSDHLDLYYAANANSPSWTLIATLAPAGGGVQTLTATYTLPSGSLQAIRGNFRYNGSASSCSTGNYDDHDDLVFATGGGGGGNVAPTAAFTSSTSGLTATFTDGSSDSDGTIASRSWNFGDGATSTATNPSHTYSTGGTYTVTLTVTDNGGATDSVSHSVTVTSPGGGGAQTASYDATLQAPQCAIVGSSCDTGTSLIAGRGTVGPESNAPNTINSSCADGNSGTYHSDESIDQITVATTDGNDFAGGKTVQVSVKVWAWNTGSADHLDLYYAADATSPSWTFIGTLNPSGGSAQTLTATYTLPAGGGIQAVRANFRYNGSASSCTSGSYNDHDDLVFATNP